MLPQKVQFRKEMEMFLTGKMSLHPNLYVVCVCLPLVIGLQASLIVYDLAVNQGRT